MYFLIKYISLRSASQNEIEIPQNKKSLFLLELIFWQFGGLFC